MALLLLREVDRRFRVTSRLAACFRDHRDPHLRQVCPPRPLSPDPAPARTLSWFPDRDQRTDSQPECRRPVRRRAGSSRLYGHYCYPRCTDLRRARAVRPAAPGQYRCGGGLGGRTGADRPQIRRRWGSGSGCAASRVLPRGPWCEAVRVRARAQRWLATLHKSRRRGAATGRACFRGTFPGAGPAG